MSPHGASSDDARIEQLEGAMVELTLLLSVGQLSASEERARSQGLTTAQLLRRALAEWIARRPLSSFERASGGETRREEN
jgi:hypothetical protein